MQTAFTRLVGCEVPVQQAGMGGISGPDLAVAVANAGGQGMIAMPTVPAPALDAMLADAATRTDGPVGVNVLVPFLDPECVEVAARRTRYVEFFYGDPDPGLVDTVHRLDALAGWQVGSAAEARAAQDAGCDLVIAQGTEAGGHVRGTMPLLPLLSSVLDTVSVPVLAAGGIASARSAAAALAAGAAGVRVGTALIPTPEADAHPSYVAALLAAGSEDTVLTEAFSTMWPGAPHRVLRSAVAAAEAAPGDVVGEVVMAGTSVPVPRLSPIAPGRDATGLVEAMALYAGQAVGEVREVRPAGEVVRELAEGAEKAL